MTPDPQDPNPGHLPAPQGWESNFNTTFGEDRPHANHGSILTLGKVYLRRQTHKIGNIRLQ